MKKLKITKRSSAIFVSVSFVFLCVSGVFIQQSISSSRVVLKDELQIHRKLLHNATQEHDCHCYSPFITNFEISNVTGTTADISWRCDAPSSYQVKWGEGTKDKYFPEDAPDDSHTEYTVTLEGLTPETEYHVGPSSICLTGCTRNDYIGKRRTEDTNGKSDWIFETLEDMTYTISGAILTPTNEGIAGVLVTLSGDHNATITTTSNGTYEFATLLPGDYTVTPTHELYAFEPPFVEYTSLNSNQADEDFKGDATSILTTDFAKTTIYEAKVSKVTAKDVTIVWKTNRDATSQIEYGLTTAYGTKTEINLTSGRNHVVQVFDFSLGATYHARAVSADPATGKAVYSADFTFKTPSHESRIIDPTTVFNEPNPAFTRTSFVYHLFQPAHRMTIDILTVSGKTVATLEAPQSTLIEGYNKVLWDLRDNTNKRVPNGVYLYKMKFYLADNQVKELKKSNLIVRR